MIIDCSALIYNPFAIIGFATRGTIIERAITTHLYVCSVKEE